MTDVFICASNASVPADAASWHVLYDAVLAPQSAVYVSVPITGGRRMLEARRSRPSAAGTTPVDIVNANLVEARALVAAVRARSSRPVIDPAAVGVVAGWTQVDYRVFWGATLRRFAAEVVFADGFEFSDGCAFEFATAIDAKIPTFGADGRPLGVENGRHLIAAGLLARRTVGAPTDVVEQVLAKLAQA